MEKFNMAFKGDIKDLMFFFDNTYKGEDFETAFKNKRKLRIKQQIYSYDLIYILYRSIDGKYVLFEREI
jgi:hypothetical protein